MWDKYKNSTFCNLIIPSLSNFHHSWLAANRIGTFLN